VLPESYIDLLDRPLATVLTTHLADGRLQSTVVWCQREGEHVLVNTMREFQKARNLRRRPWATLVVLEPGDAGRWIEIRARVVEDPRDALAHLDAVTQEYTGTKPYFGAVVPEHLAEVEHPVVFRLVPEVVRTGPSRIAGGGTAVVPRGPVRRRTWSCQGEPQIPASHHGLMERALAVLSTRMPDGSAQTNPVWCSLDGNDILVNTTAQRRKGRNLAADPRATILVLDPVDSGRYLEVRGDAELIDEDALAHLDLLTERYTGEPHYYGAMYPEQQRHCESRVIARIHPRRITCDAIH
jgi:PPOX class probable F420-dependent enzyme